MKSTSETSSKDPQATLVESTCAKDSCRTGGCGGPGLCPGIALLLAYLGGAGVALLTGMVWLGWVVGIPIGIILITGAWRFLPRRSKP